MKDPVKGVYDAVDCVDESADVSRRKLLKAGAVGAAAAGVLAAGGPSVLGLGTAPAYAAGASAGGDTTIAPPSTGSVSVRIDLKDGQLTAASPVNIPASGTGTAYLYASADRSTPPVASVAVSLLAGQTFVEYTFSGVAPGHYFVDIQQPFDGYGAAGLAFAGNTYYVDWNFGHRSVPDGYEPQVLDEYQPVTVTAGGTADVDVDVQVALETTPPPWP